jgi:hypothetical protein
VVDADGKNAREIVKKIGVAVLDSAFWSPDGKQIAVVLLDWKKGMVNLTRDAEQANFRIEIMDVDGKNRRELKLADAKLPWVDMFGACGPAGPEALHRATPRGFATLEPSVFSALSQGHLVVFGGVQIPQRLKRRINIGQLVLLDDSCAYGVE